MMSTQNMVQYRNIENDNIKMTLLLVMHCAPVLKGIKAANIVMVTMREFFQIRYLLQGTELSYRFLKTKGENGILYLFREKDILHYLSSRKIQSFLREYGYESGSLDEMLERLSDRIAQYYKGETVFPHEIGVFLEYPLLDVKGFIENEGKNSAFSGYWKVYHNVQEAVRKFKQYDEERERAIKAVVAGKTIRDIIANSPLRKSVEPHLEAATE